jgi:antirestriction protein ArdC
VQRDNSHACHLSREWRRYRKRLQQDELVHSTGHSSRLNREFGLSFGDDLYSREELVAEMGAAFLCAIAGISNERTEKNTTAYLQNWISVLTGTRAWWSTQHRKHSGQPI